MGESSSGYIEALMEPQAMKTQYITNFGVISERFQMVSLLKLANITEEGVRFLSPHDGSPM